jgi:primosomal protein N' (replication factor Y)
MAFAEVALPLPLRRTFTYRVPDDLAARALPGAQVQVPFRQRNQRGVIVSRAVASELEDPRAIGAVLPGAPLPPHLMELAAWIAEYYVAPLGEVLAATLPGGLEGFAGSRARRGAIEDPVLPLALGGRLTLSAAQRAAVTAIESAMAEGGFAPFLLHGITASGKTEVYLRAAQDAREQGRQTLMLVPEIALGSQVVAAFRARFGARVGLLHSYLSLGERRRTWELARRGALDVVVGARSAVFAPLPNLGLVLVDEEHEPAYKQSEQLRYHGRDTAVRRAQLLGIPVVLGSATPSLESLANAARGKYRRLSLPERVTKRSLPAVRVVDLRREGEGAAMLSRPLHAALVRRLECGEQALLFLNRRGHSHHTQCRGCGFVPRCTRCDITLTLHLSPREWRCHYCGHHEPAGAQCPKCGAALLRFSGAGTQRVERELAARLPQARVLRLDTDVARERHDPGRILRSFARGDADILLGTQMIAKGLDFPRVTLVGVLDADVALQLPDFRAAERTWQLLVQVSGRAGRGAESGEVFVQTCTPEHPAVQAAVLHQPRAFIEPELEQRREAGYPPYRRLVAVLFTGADERDVERAAKVIADALGDPGGGIEVLGPAPQALAKLRDRFRWHLLLKGTNAARLRAVATRALDAATQPGFPRAVGVTVDVDPGEVL